MRHQTHVFDIGDFASFSRIERDTVSALAIYFSRQRGISLNQMPLLLLVHATALVIVREVDQERGLLIVATLFPADGAVVTSLGSLEPVWQGGM